MTELDNQQSDLFGGLGFDPMAKQYIRSMAGWAMVIVTVSVIGYLLNIAELFRDPKPDPNRPEGFDTGIMEKMGASDVFMTIFLIAIGLLINFFLYRFARQARTGIDGLSQPALNSSFSNLKAYFMATSIILLIVFVLFLLFAIVVGTRTAMAVQ